MYGREQMKKLSKIESAEEFLKGLENTESCLGIMMDRVDVDILRVIHNYSGLIAKTCDKNTLDMSLQDLITCTVLIGYLLKTHVDRFELEVLQEKNN